LIPAAPLILESQGFYDHPLLGPRRDILWPLFKGCFITTIGLVLVMYVLHFVSPRVVMMFFGVISFTLVYLKEELVRWALRSKFGQSQYQRRFILIGTRNEIARLGMN
jgi:FlaA1/EpsC-like NDP-sugar epimerase